MGYCEYMDDYLEDAESEMLRAVGFGEASASGKPKPYRENYYFRDHLQTPKVTPILAKPVNRDKVIDFTGRFIDEHEKQLSTAGPVYIFTFGEKEVAPLYELFNTNAAELLELYNQMVEETWNVDEEVKESVDSFFLEGISKFFTGWVNQAPHKVLLTCMLVDAIQHDYDDIVTCCEYLWAFCEYPIMYRKYWSLGVKPDLMEYTIEHLGSKYKIKKVAKTLKDLLKYDATVCVNNHADRLKTGYDHTYTDFMYRFRNQIKNTFENLANAYYINDKAGASQHTQASQFDDGSMADQEGRDSIMAKAIDTTINKFATGTINMPMIRVSADNAKVDKDNLAGYVNQIMSTKENRLNKLVEDIITAYFNRNPAVTDIGSSEFLNFGLAMYRSIGSSKDPIYVEVKEILAFWMDGILSIHETYQREATVISYTRAIFNYIVLMIMYYN